MMSFILIYILCKARIIIYDPKRGITSGVILWPVTYLKMRHLLVGYYARILDVTNVFIFVSLLIDNFMWENEIKLTFIYYFMQLPPTRCCSLIRMSVLLCGGLRVVQWQRSNFELWCCLMYVLKNFLLMMQQKQFYWTEHEFIEIWYKHD